MGLVPSQTKVVVRVLVPVVIESSIILGAARLALWARIRSAAAFPFIYPHPYW